MRKKTWFYAIVTFAILGFTGCRTETAKNDNLMVTPNTTITMPAEQQNGIQSKMDNQNGNQKDSQKDNQNDNQKDSQNDNQKDSQKDNQNDNLKDSQKDNQNDNQNDSHKNTQITAQRGENTAYVDPEDPLDVIITGKVKDRIYANDSLNLVTSVEKLAWVSDDNLAVICHINPSLQCFLLYNLKTKKLGNEKYGFDFTWKNENINSLIYIVPKPHFSGKGEETVRNYEDKILYEAPKDTAITDIAWANENQIKIKLKDSNGKETEELIKIDSIKKSE